MRKKKIYTYLGSNGILQTEILFEELPHTESIRLIADNGKMLTNGSIKTFEVTVPESEVESWKEIKE